MEDRLKQGEALFAEGKIEEAEKCFLDFLDQNPEDAEALNNLGAIHHTRGNVKEAEGYFFKALEVKEDYPDALLNLADLYQNAKRWEEAALQLEKSIAIDDRDHNLYNQLGMVYLEMGDSPKAREVLVKSLKLNPDQEIVRQSLSVLEKKDASLKDSKKEIEKGEAFFNVAHSQQNRRAKIAVLCLPGLQSFLGDIVDYLKTKYDVRTCYSNNNQEIESAVKWADVVWLEWANELSVHITRNIPELSKKKVICRLHSYEAFTNYPKQIDWTLIDALVVVADHIKNIILELTPEAGKRAIYVIPNGINLDKWRFAERKPGYEIAYVGSINYKKGSILLPHILKAVCDREPRYRLHIAGEIQDPRYIFYFKQAVQDMGLADNFVMHGRVDDVDSWLEDKNYIVSTSLLESQQLSLCEAMAKGIKPVIHNFVGARSLYSDECIFNTIDEAVKMICAQKYESTEFRRFVLERYGLNDQLQKIDIVLQNIISCDKLCVSGRRRGGIPATEGKNDLKNDTIVKQTTELEKAFENALCIDENFADAHFNLCNLWGKVCSYIPSCPERTTRVVRTVRWILNNSPDDKDQPLLHENRRLRKSLLAKYAQICAGSGIKILLHCPDAGALRYLMASWHEVLNYMGVKTALLNFGENCREVCERFKPSVLITVADSAYIKWLDMTYLKQYRSSHGLHFGHITTFSERYKPCDFLITFHLDPIRDQVMAKTDLPLLSLPFAINPLRHYMRPARELWDFFFVGTNSPLNVQETRDYLLPIIRKYKGILAGTGWSTGLSELSIEQAAFFYNCSRIYPNFHLKGQREEFNELNERTYIIPACGGFELVDNAMALPELFKSDEMAVAQSVAEYREMFEYFTRYPEERLPYIRKGMERVWKDYTLFNVLTRLCNFLGIPDNTMLMDEPKISDQSNHAVTQARDATATFRNKPKISVLIPTRNRSQLLAQSLDCLTKQSYTNLEVVIVDDCSDDKTPTVVERFRQSLPNLVYTRNETRIGAAHSFKKAAELATGDYVLNFSDDDLLADGALNVFAEPLEKKDYDLIYSDLSVIDEDNQQTAVWSYQSYHDLYQLLRKLIDAGGNVIPEVLLIKKDIYSAVYSEMYSKRLVGPFYLPSLRWLQMYHINKPLYRYRVHKKSTFSNIGGLILRNKSVLNHLNLIMFMYSPVDIFQTGFAPTLSERIVDGIIHFILSLLSHAQRFFNGQFYTGCKYKESDFLWAIFYEYASYWQTLACKYNVRREQLDQLKWKIGQHFSFATYDAVKVNMLPIVYYDLPWFSYRTYNEIRDFVVFDMVTVGKKPFFNRNEYVSFREGDIQLKATNKVVADLEQLRLYLNSHPVHVVNIVDPDYFQGVLDLLVGEQRYFLCIVNATGKQYPKELPLKNTITIDPLEVRDFATYLTFLNRPICNCCAKRSS